MIEVRVDVRIYAEDDDAADAVLAAFRAAADTDGDNVRAVMRETSREMVR